MNREKSIDEFLNNKLSNLEKQSFLQEMENNAELKAEVELMEELNAAIQHKGNLKLKEQLGFIQNDYLKNQKQSSKVDLKNILLGILAIASLCFIAYLISSKFFKKANDQPKNLYAAYYKPYEASFDSRSSLELSHAMASKYYDSEQYPQAIKYLQEIIANNPNNYDAKLALGNSYLNTKQHDSSIKILNEMIKDPDHLFADQARWFLAMNYLKMNDHQKCIQLIKPLVEDQYADYHKEANSLLSKLKK